MNPSEYSFDITAGESHTEEHELVVFQNGTYEADIETEIFVNGEEYSGDAINTSGPEEIEVTTGSNFFDITIETANNINSSYIDSLTSETSATIGDPSNNQTEEQKEQKEEEKTENSNKGSGSGGDLPVVDGGEDENVGENQDQNEGSDQENNQNDTIGENKDNNQTTEQKPSIEDVIDDPIENSSDIKQKSQFLDNPKSMTVLNTIFLSITGLVIALLTVI